MHFIAGLRFLLAAAGQEIKQLAGFSALLDDRLIPVDTIHAVALTQDGRSGTIGISFATEFKSGLEIEIVTTNGSVTWSPTSVKTKSRKADGSDGEEVDEQEFPYSSGVTAEVGAFALAIEAGKIDAIQTPGEALKDLEILQRLLESGAGGASIQKIGL